MKKLSLQKKIYLVGLMPFCFYLISMLFSLQSNYLVYEESKALKGKMNVIKHSSSFVHELQRERGRSFDFFEGVASFSDLKEQRKISDTQMNQLLISLEKSYFKDSVKKNLVTDIRKIKKMREKVGLKSISLEKMSQVYSDAIVDILNLQSYLALNTSFPIITSKLKGLRVLEGARESAGKLRANMSSVLAKNKAISEKDLIEMIELKAGVIQGISSSALALDSTGKSYVEKFKKSSEWNSVVKTFKLIVRSSSFGSYNKDPKEFFKTMTKALSIMENLIIYRENKLEEKVAEIETAAIKSFWQNVIILTCLTFTIFFFISYMSKNITGKVRLVITSLGRSSEDVSSSSDHMSLASVQLENISKKQSSSLQETASSLSEISSMVEKNAEAAGQSKLFSEKSREEALNGKKNIEQMIFSIDDIAKSNNEMMNKIEENNDRIGKITQVIAEISEKTKVINDIAFQTKLLSFNASVEAVRAGEHGKGFAVVAEEVGSLATMSGKAALEISELLETSTVEVKDIIEFSKRELQSLGIKGKEKLDYGTNVARKCEESLGSILKNIDSVNDMVKEISSASSEQALGVREITGAIQEIDQSSHKRTFIAQESSGTSNVLKENAHNLSYLVRELILLVEGKSEKKFAVKDKEVSLPENVLRYPGALMSEKKQSIN